MQNYDSFVRRAVDEKGSTASHRWLYYHARSASADHRRRPPELRFLQVVSFDVGSLCGSGQLFYFLNSIHR
jgi:hypothetical protein